MRMAMRATVTSLTAIAAAIAIDSTALPRLKAESKGMRGSAPAAVRWTSAFQGHLVWVAVPGLLCGIAAVTFKPLRQPLAWVAMGFSAVALYIIVGSLLSAMAPMYQIQTDLGT